MSEGTIKASGWVMYATVMFVIIGILDVIYGLTMIINDEWVVFTADTIWYLDISAWGWITLLMGVVALAVAGGVYTGQTWARVVGIVAGVLAAVNAFFVMPYYTVWGIAILAMSMLVIWALAVHGDEAT
jgi:hypothetical protein